MSKMQGKFIKLPHHQSRRNHNSSMQSPSFRPNQSRGSPSIDEQESIVKQRFKSELSNRFQPQQEESQLPNLKKTQINYLIDGPQLEKVKLSTKREVQNFYHPSFEQFNSAEKPILLETAKSRAKKQWSDSKDSKYTSEEAENLTRMDHKQMFSYMKSRVDQTNETDMQTVAEDDELIYAKNENGSQSREQQKSQRKQAQSVDPSQ